MVSEPPADSSSQPESKFLLLLQVSASLFPSDEFVHSHGTYEQLFAQHLISGMRDLFSRLFVLSSERAEPLCLVSSLFPVPLTVPGTQRVLIKLLSILND